MSKGKCVVILAAGKISALNVGFGTPICDHPALYPAGSQLALHCIINHYQSKHNIKHFIVVIDKPLPESIPIRGFGDVDFQLIKPQDSIIDSLSSALEAINHQWVIVNPITTIPSLYSIPDSFINIGNNQLYQENWASLVSPNNTSEDWVFVKKNSALCTLRSYPFTGIIGAQKSDINECATRISKNNKYDLVNLAEALYEGLQVSIVKSDWLDIGHYATYAESKLAKINSRAFNSLHYCKKQRSVVKSSTDHQRLKSESEYLENIGSNLKRYFPHILNDPNDDKQTLQLQSIPFPSLGELYLHWDIGPNAWYKIIDEIFFISTELGNSNLKLIGSSSWLYEDKLTERYTQFCRDSFENNLNFGWWKNNICINGRWVQSLNKHVDCTLKQLKKLSQNSTLQLIHGDLCFNNILCDPVYTSICLIDPRGEKSTILDLPRGYGDSRYDFAKFLHSLLGNYDSIVNNMFSINWISTDSLIFNVHCPTAQELYLNMFKEKLFDSQIDYDNLLLLTSSLFFSMLPLHKEDTNRQAALAIMGIILKDMHDHACSYTSSRSRFSF